MELINKLFSSGVRELTQSIGDSIDKLSTSDEEKLKAKSELSQIVGDKLTQLAEFQKQALMADLNGSKLQRNWRPIVMLSFALVVVYSKFIAPAFSLPNTHLEGEFWTLLEIGIGGYVMGRSIEKVSDTVTKNIDMTFLKKKDRNTGR